MKNRAWCLINTDNLEHNIKSIEKVLPKDTKIMAVIKGNAYGHDALLVAKKLNEMGIEDFAVASLDEGIKLRKNKIKGNILILGYTEIKYLKEVIKYDLIQTGVGVDYLNKIMQLNLKDLKIHLKINTGMNRIGIPYNDYSYIKECYEKLNILGIYSHLAVSNSNKKSDALYTKMQIKRFDDVINYLKSENINVGKTHLQASYGILNYNECKYDYVRVGIIMYGVYNDLKTYHKINIDLLPVLTLQAKITSLINLKKGEYVGYGRCYKAKRDELIASVSIGYIDGYSKFLEGKNIKVKVNGKYALVIGKICMDQLIIKVSNIPSIKVGDIVTLIGKDKYIRGEYLASKMNTITPLIYGTLGSRLEYIEEKNN